MRCQKRWKAAQGQSSVNDSHESHPSTSTISRKPKPRHQPTERFETPEETSKQHPQSTSHMRSSSAKTNLLSVSEEHVSRRRCFP
eukprot:176246-Rhodomonas_salina.5